MNNMSKKQEIIGLIDADLLDNGTRHPNLVLLKLAGFFHDNGIPFELILDPQANTLHYTRIYLSCVFTFTKLLQISGITSKNGRNGTKWLNVMPLQCQVMPSRKCLKSKEKQN